MREHKLPILLTPLFVAALALLLANDFVFKPLFHNWLTGKLSDFTGLVAFFIFWTAFFPRHNRSIGLVITTGFVYWKSAWSQPLIDGWNSLAFYRIGRVVDPTDLTALIVLPGADFYTRRFAVLKSLPAHSVLRMQLRRLAICLARAQQAQQQEMQNNPLVMKNL